MAGMFVLFYGTAIYNAPNPGSLKLEGQWWAFGFDLSHEYREVEDELEDAKMDAAAAGKPPPSPYLHTMSPFISTPGGSRLRQQGSGQPGQRPARGGQRSSYGATEMGRARGDSVA